MQPLRKLQSKASKRFKTNPFDSQYRIVQDPLDNGESGRFLAKMMKLDLPTFVAGLLLCILLYTEK